MRRLSSRPALTTAIALAMALSATACATDDVTAPPPVSAGAFTVDATSQWVYVSLRDSAIVTPTPSASESEAWDLAFNATNVTLNGGQAGPGGVTGPGRVRGAAHHRGRRGQRRHAPRPPRGA